MRFARALAALVAAAVWMAVSPADASPTPGPLRDAAALFARGHLADAERTLMEVTTRRPGDPAAWLWLGVVQYHRLDYARAEQSLAYAARLAPRDGVVLLWWGHALLRANRPGDAGHVFRQVLLARGTPMVHEAARQALRATGPIPILAPSRADAALRSPSAPAWVLDVASYRAIARFYNPRLSPQQADRIARALLGYSWQFGIDPRLVVALVVVESGFQPAAVSRAGALGLGQLMPATARALGVDPRDPEQNLYGSIRYLRGGLDRFGWTQPHLALAAYNAGRGAVERYAGIPPYAETRWYVTNVASLYRRLLAIPGDPMESSRHLLGD